MGDDKLSVLKNQDQNQQYTQFSDCNGDFQILLNDIKSFILFLRLICKNKYEIKTLQDMKSMNNNTSEFNNASSEFKGVDKNKCIEGDSVTKKFDNTNLLHLARNLLDKFESMKACEIYNQIHLGTGNNIRDDIIHFMNLLENKCITDKKIQFQRRNKETNTDRSCFYKNVKRNFSTVTPSKPVGSSEVKEEKCISNKGKNIQQSFLLKSKVFDLKMFKNFRPDYETENLLSKVPLSNNDIDNMTKNSIELIGTTKAECSNTSNFTDQNHNPNMKDDNSVIREVKVAPGRNIKREASCSTEGTNKLYNFLQKPTELDYNVLENDKDKNVAENTITALDEELSVHKIQSRCVDDRLSKKNKAYHKKVSKRDFTQNYCHDCVLQSSSTELDIQDCPGGAQQKSTAVYKNIISELSDKHNPSTVTVQNVTDMLLSLCVTLNSAPSYIKEQRIMDLNPPTSMKEAVYVLEYVTKCINDSKQTDATDCVKGKDTNKVIFKKSYEHLQNWMTLLASSSQEKK